MTDYTELKRAAEACKDALPLRYMESHGSLYIRNDHGIVFDVHQNRSFPEFMAANKAYADLVLAANPATVLRLLAESAEQDRIIKHMVDQCMPVEELKHQPGHARVLTAEVLLIDRDQLKAENEALRKVLASAHDFILNDARTRHMCDETGHVSPLFPKRKGVLSDIDAAMGKGEQA